MFYGDHIASLETSYCIPPDLKPITQIQFRITIENELDSWSEVGEMSLPLKALLPQHFHVKI